MLSYMFPKLASIPCVLSSGMTVPIDKERKLKRKSTNSLPSEDHTLTIFVYKELQAYLIGCHVWFVNGSTMSSAFFGLAVTFLYGIHSGKSLLLLPSSLALVSRESTRLGNWNWLRIICYMHGLLTFSMENPFNFG